MVKRRQRFQIELSPLDQSSERRYQLLAVIGWILLILTVGPVLWGLSLYLAYTTFWAKYLIIAYFIWIYLDRKTCENGGRRVNWWRRLKWWRYYGEYFPIKLVKTTDLSPDKNYIFGVHPHGILLCGVFISLVTDALDFEKVFKGLKTYTCTLDSEFRMPFIREMVLAYGLNSASENSINWILGSPGKGRVAVIVVGGQRESYLTKSGTYRIVLERRKGFCRLALQNGSPLVPVFSFGENELYENVFLTGVLIKRTPITVVVGKPIEVQQIKNPTKEQIDEVHKKYKEALIELFNEGRKIYLKDPKTELIIVE